MEEHSSQEVGRYVVRVYWDDIDRGVLDSRDCDNVGRVAGLAEYAFNDDDATYREIREQAGEPILALPLDCWSQSYTLLREAGSWDGAGGFYWAPMSAIEREGFDGIEGLRECLRGEIKSLAQELAGDIYGYVVENISTGEQEDSCWGFIGEPDYAMGEGVAVAEWANLRDAINWASLPQWVQETVMIRAEVDA